MKKTHLYLSKYGKNHEFFKFLKVNYIKTTCSKNKHLCSFLNIDRYYKYTKNYRNLRYQGSK